jgi:class 3 adenylate cyclase/tetratricopeptide (TPR) repeat protein
VRDPEQELVRCRACGHENAASARFCNGCGSRLDATTSRPRESRRTVTVLFCDVAGSTRLGERLDPETLRGVMSRYFDAARLVLERHGGTVEKFIGDAVMAVFGIPVLHDDDALRAVRAASDLRDALEELNVPLEASHGVRIAVRTGINTGEVVAGDTTSGQPLVTGDAVNVAARLEQAAGPDEILIGRATHRLVRDAVTAEPVAPLSLKGKQAPTDALRLIAVTRGAEGHARRFESPLVGREREVRLLREAYEDVAAGGRCYLFTLLGPAGVGKSRLVREFIDGLPEALVLRGRCLPYGEGITYWPMAEAIRAAARVGETDKHEVAREKLFALLRAVPDGELVATRVGQALGVISNGVAQEEVHWGVRRCFESVAADRPLVLVVDDIQWAETSLLDLLEYIADWSSAPILLLCIARPELLELRSGWGGGKLNATTVLLEPLPADASERLIDGLPGGSALDERIRMRITDAAEGNPLFVEEMLAMLIDDGHVTRQPDGTWTAQGDVAAITVPPTIQALLAARLDRLAPRERAVAERASVVGRVFERGAVEELTPEPEREGLAVGLLALVRKELVRPDRVGLAGEEAYRFRHLLIRDAAYQALPKSERADLHERFAAWLERVAGDRLEEYVEIVAYHLDQALTYRRELGTDAGSELARRTLEYWLRAATKSESSGSYPEAIAQLEHALTVHRSLPPGVTSELISRVSLIWRLGDAYRLGGDHDRAVAVLQSALDAREGDPNPDEVVLSLDRIGRYLWELGDALRSRASHEEATRRMPAEPNGTRARALAGMARLQMLRSRHEEAVPLAREALLIARQIGERRLEGDAMNTLGTALVGIGATDEGLSALHDSLAIAQEQTDASGILRAYNNLAATLENLGRYAESEAAASEGINAARQLGLQRSIGGYLAVGTAMSFVFEGRASEARALLTRALDDGVTGSTASFAWLARNELEFAGGELPLSRESLRLAHSAAAKVGAGRDMSHVLAAEARLAAEEARHDEALSLTSQWLEIDERLTRSNAIAEDQVHHIRLGLGVIADVWNAPEVTQTTRAACGELRDRLVGALEEYRKMFALSADRFDRVSLLIAEAELARIERHPSVRPAQWRAAIDAAASSRLRLFQSYAQRRYLESLVAAGAPLEEISAALREARATAAAAGALLDARHIDEIGAASREHSVVLP